MHSRPSRYGDPSCDHQWSGPLDKHPTCVKCDMAYTLMDSRPSREAIEQMIAELIGVESSLDEARERLRKAMALAPVAALPSEPPSDPERLCAKCDGSDTAVRWDANFYDCLAAQQTRRDWPRDGGEHLHRQCRTCGWTWAAALRSPATEPTDT